MKVYLMVDRSEEHFESRAFASYDAAESALFDEVRELVTEKYRDWGDWVWCHDEVTGRITAVHDTWYNVYYVIEECEVEE